MRRPREPFRRCAKPPAMQRWSTLRYERLILATGARERFFLSPAGPCPESSEQAVCKRSSKADFPCKASASWSQAPAHCLLAVAVHLREYGAHVTSVAEQAPLSQLHPFAASLWSHPAKILQGIGYRAALGKTPYRTGCWPVSAVANEATGFLKSVRLTDGDRRPGTNPAISLPAAFTSCPTPSWHLCSAARFAATSSKSTSSSRPQLQISTARESQPVSPDSMPLWSRARSPDWRAPDSRPALCALATPPSRRFAARLESAFRLRPELRLLASLDTIVCRCEDVTYENLAARSGWTDAKLQTRCGMGPCQGRICGPATQTLFGWTPKSVRPPLFPVPVSALCFHESQHDCTSGECMIWSGVMPAMTTPFDTNLAVDHPFLAQHAAWLLGNGCTGLVMLGSLGEGATLEQPREGRDPQDSRARRAGKDAGRRGDLFALHRERRPPRQRGRAGRLPGPDGPSALRLHLRLARDEEPRLHHHRGDQALLHALQQPRRLQDRLPAQRRSPNSPQSTRISTP